MKNKQMTAKEMVLAIADRDGYHLPPAHYKHAAKKKFGIEPSSSVITRALGAYRSRLQLPERLVLAKAKDLLVACTMDTALAASMVHRAFKEA